MEVVIGPIHSAFGRDRDRDSLEGASLLQQSALEQRLLTALELDFDIRAVQREGPGNGRRRVTLGPDRQRDGRLAFREVRSTEPGRNETHLALGGEVPTALPYRTVRLGACDHEQVLD